MSNTNAVVLEIRGFHIPAMKNGKMLTRGRLITDPEKQRTMDVIIQSFESQLSSIILTSGGVTMTTPTLQSLIAWSLRFDDSRQWIPSHSVDSDDVDKGNEGCTVTIEMI